MRTISSMTADAPPTGPTRRQLLQAALPLLGLASLSVRSQPQPIPIADMHSHYGMVRRSMTGAGLADDMRRQRVALVAWKLIADGPWIRSGSTGISQVAEPSPGSLAARFETQLGRMKAHATSNGLKLVLTPADVDACIAGEPGIVLACEGADFLEGQVDRLAAAHRQGLRHLQLVHYIRTPVGDFQTASPVHQGLSAMGRQLVEACNDRRIVVDWRTAPARPSTRRWPSPGRPWSGRMAGSAAPGANGKTPMATNGGGCRSNTPARSPRAVVSSASGRSA